MFNLSEIIQNAQGGQAIGNLAQQFGLAPDEAERAVSALIPALSQGFLNQASSSGGLGGLLGGLMHPDHQASFSDPQAAAANADTGNAALGNIFGSNSVVGQIIERASAASGVSPDVLRGMLPVLASIVMGGLAKGMSNQGFGGLLGELASAAKSGGLGSILGQLGGGGAAAQPGTASGGGGWGGIAGAVLGSLFNGGAGGTQPAGGGTVDPNHLGAGLNSLTNMLRPGPAGGGGDLERDISSILGGGGR